MPKTNVAIVQGMLDEFRRSELESAFEHLDPDIEWDASRLTELIPDMAGVYRGHDGVRAYWRGWLQAWRDL